MNRGQASLDYLTTYGWALIVLAIALGAVYTFVDYRSEVNIPETCSFGDSFNCIDFQINATSEEISLKLNNAVGTEITLAATSCTYIGVSVTDNSVQDMVVAPGADFFVTCDLTDTNTTLKKKSKVDLTVIYYKKGMSYPSSSDGFVAGGIMK